MAVLSKEDFTARLKARIGDDDSDEALSFLEDMTDTFNDLETRSANKDGEDWKKKYEDNDKAWREKYKSRFYDSGTTPEDVKKEQTEDVKDDGTETTFDDLFVEREG